MNGYFIKCRSLPGGRGARRGLSGRHERGRPEVLGDMIRPQCVGRIRVTEIQTIPGIPSEPIAIGSFKDAKESRTGEGGEAQVHLRAGLLRHHHHHHYHHIIIINPHPLVGTFLAPKKRGAVLEPGLASLFTAPEMLLEIPRASILQREERSNTCNDNVNDAADYISNVDLKKKSSLVEPTPPHISTLFAKRFFEKSNKTPKIYIMLCIIFMYWGRGFIYTQLFLFSIPR
jgi:hypothetical protein